MASGMVEGAGDQEADQVPGAGSALAEARDHRRDGRGQKTADRGGGSHGAARQRDVEAGEREAAGDARDQSPDQRCAVREGSAAEDGDQKQDREARRVAQQQHAQRRAQRSAGVFDSHAARKIAASPKEGGEQTEQDIAL
jgi:hypothetical protein